MPARMEDCLVLYVEDDDATACLFQMAMRKADPMPQIFRVTDGHKACSYLTHAPPYTEASAPDLIVLDLNLPTCSGLTSSDSYVVTLRSKTIPVYVFTSSSDVRDRAMAVALGAEGYLTKGDPFQAFVESAKTICSALSTDAT